MLKISKAWLKNRKNFKKYVCTLSIYRCLPHTICITQMAQLHYLSLKLIHLISNVLICSSVGYFFQISFYLFVFSLFSFLFFFISNCFPFLALSNTLYSVTPSTFSYKQISHLNKYMSLIRYIYLVLKIVNWNTTYAQVHDFIVFICFSFLLQKAIGNLIKVWFFQPMQTFEIWDQNCTNKCWHRSDKI